jgi:hypothetical protein
MTPADDRPLPGDLAAVAEAATARLRAEAHDDAQATQAASEAMVRAATSALAAGRELSAIAQAEAYGQKVAREELGDEALKRIERTRRKVRDAQADHHRAIEGAIRLGISARKIAAVAGVNHGTIHAYAKRVDERATAAMEPEPEPLPDPELQPEGEPAEG